MKAWWAKSPGLTGWTPTTFRLKVTPWPSGMASSTAESGSSDSSVTTRRPEVAPRRSTFALSRGRRSSKRRERSISWTPAVATACRRVYSALSPATTIATIDSTNDAIATEGRYRQAGAGLRTLLISAGLAQHATSHHVRSCVQIVPRNVRCSATRCRAAGRCGTGRGTSRSGYRAWVAGFVLNGDEGPSCDHESGSHSCPRWGL